MAPLTEDELERRLDALLNPVLSSRRTASPLARAIAQLNRERQEFTLHWAEVISRTNYELAYQFAAVAPAALTTLDTRAAETWIIHAMDSYDREGLFQGGEVFRHYSAFETPAESQHGVGYREAAPVIELFVCGLSGRRMKIDSAPAAWTDGETLYLPPRIALGPTRAENFLLYKIIATLLWAQSRYGTFAADLNAAVRPYADPARALTWLNYLESVRLEARLARLLPGLARDMRTLAVPQHDALGDTAPYPSLCSPDATVHDSIALLLSVRMADNPPRRAWMSSLHPAEATAARAARLAREKSALQAALADLLDEQPADDTEANGGDAETGFTADVERDDSGEMSFQLRLGGEAIEPPPAVKNLMDSILQDLGDIPDDYLAAKANTETLRDRDEAPAGPADHLSGAEAQFYDEWDHQRKHYRKNWCALRESDVAAGDGTFVAATLAKYAQQVIQLRRTFELLRGEDRLLKRITHGDDFDLDALMDAFADMQSGRELSERLFTRRHKAERNLAVLFMVDMSGSTKGWINDAERESLVLLAEALEILGDRYAIYGFSGVTRKRCEIYRVKRFDEPYNDVVQQRIAGIAPQDYTRMGVAIRHLTALFECIDARTKLLITLSDGKPDDYSDNYRGEYGIEDTRQALFEAHRAGVKPFCITIDREARDYLPHMYGAANWTLVDDVSRLPLQVADIYRRLTS